MNKFVFSGCLIWILCFGQVVSAQIIAEYTNSTTATTVAGNVTASTETISNGTMSPNCTNANPTAMRCSAGAFNQTVPTHYVQFKVTPNVGYKFTVDKITVNPRRTAAGPNRLRIDYSTNNGASFSMGGEEVVTDLGSCVFTTQFTNDPVDFDVTNTTNGIIVRAYYWVNSGTATGNLDFNSFALIGSVTLPIELTAFSCKISGQHSLLSFATSSERDNDYFVIERGDNVIRFEEIGQLKGAGDSNEPQHYTFTDKTPLPGKNYYRLRQVDFDGKFSYSHAVSVNFGSDDGITLSPVPVRDQLRIKLEKASQEDGTWQILDVSGRILRSGIFPAESIEYQINTGDLPEGSHVFRLVAGREVWVRRF